MIYLNDSFYSGTDTADNLISINQNAHDLILEFNEQNNNLAKIYFESDNIVVYVINNQETNIG